MGHKFALSRLLMVICVFAIISIAAIYLNLYIYSVYENTIAQRAFTLIEDLGGILILWSYLGATLTHAGRPSNRRIDISGNLKLNYCNKCRNWKPDRSHHCKKCDCCILKMDHHCPWTASCIGYYNFKSYILLFFYCIICGIYFISNSIYYLISITRETYEELGLVHIIIIVQITGIAFFSIILTMVLLLENFKNILHNTTPIEQKINTKTNIACMTILTQKAKNSIPNQYDLGLILNLFEFFGGNPLFWFLPIKLKYNIGYLSGMKFRKIPDATNKNEGLLNVRIRESHDDYFLRKSEKYPVDLVNYDDDIQIELELYNVDQFFV